MINKTILVGNVGKDPEFKQFEDGGGYLLFSLATQDDYKGKDGVWVKQTDWHKIVVKSKGLAGSLADRLRSGNRVYIEGMVKTRDYEKDGGKVYITEIVIKGFGGVCKILGSNEERPEPRSQPSQSRLLSDDDIPF